MIGVLYREPILETASNVRSKRTGKYEAGSDYENFKDGTVARHVIFVWQKTTAAERRCSTEGHPRLGRQY